MASLQVVHVCTVMDNSMYDTHFTTLGTLHGALIGIYIHKLTILAILLLSSVQMSLTWPKFTELVVCRLRAITYNQRSVNP